jgi:two-component system, cell cycle sensor histidine kinase and response regulator CckA
MTEGGVQAISESGIPGIRGELQALEERYTSLFGMNPDPLVALDLDGRITAVNAALEFLTGQTVADILGRGLQALVTPADAERAGRHFQRAAQGEAQSFEVAVPGPDGREIALALTLVPTRVGGEVRGVHGIARNVTAVREVEAALREAEERYALVAENLHDMVSLHDTQGVFIYASPSALTLLGFHPVELVGRSVYGLVEPADVPQLRAAHAAIMQRAGRGPVAFRVRRQDDTVRWFESTARMISREDDDTPWRIIATTRDITERRAVEEQALQAHKMEALGRLAGAVAHDFNNVLTVIGGHAELLIQRLGDGPGHEDAERIRSAALQAASLARQLLTFERGSGTEPLPLDANSTLLELQPLLTRLLGAQVRLALELEPGLHAMRFAAGALEQVVMNLAVNARDAMQQGGALVIRTENVDVAAGERPGLEGGSYVLLTFSDTGAGMTAEVMDRLFEPFFTTKGGEGGTGLGLSTVYSLVRHAGGDVGVESVPGEGSTFRLWFQARHGETAAPGQRAETAGPLHGTETILVAEDDPGVRSLVAAVLQRHGYSVMTAADGRQGVELHDTFGHLVHLIITDISMPDMTGPDFVRAVQAAGARQPVLFMSGLSADALPPVDAAPRHFLAKPFTPLQLAQAVRKVLDEPAS